MTLTVILPSGVPTRTSIQVLAQLVDWLFLPGIMDEVIYRDLTVGSGTTWLHALKWHRNLIRHLVRWHGNYRHHPLWQWPP